LGPGLVGPGQAGWVEPEPGMAPGLVVLGLLAVSQGPTELV